MDFYHRAKELYGQGQYTQALILLDKCLDEKSSPDQLKDFYSLVLLSTVELKNIEKFKTSFYQIKDHFLQQHEILEWIKILKDLCKYQNLPEFFIREEYIKSYKEIGLIQELRDECQEFLDESIKKRRININLQFYQDILGDHVEIYGLLFKIHGGEYEDATEKIKKIKKKLNDKKFNKVSSFIASNIRPDECKRIEVKDIIIDHLLKKIGLEIEYYDSKSIIEFEKSIIRNFINLIIIDFDNLDHIVHLLEFIVLTKNEKLRRDLLSSFEHFPGLKDDKRFKNLINIPFKNKREARQDFKNDKAIPSINNSIEQKAANVDYLESVVLRGSLGIQDDRWFVKEFRQIITVLIEAKFYNLGLDIIKKIKEINDGQISAVDISYFEAELCLLAGNYIDAVKVCQEILDLKNLNASEEICFEYLKAESYFSLGERERAYRGFYKVLSINPSYRLAKERIKIIEKESK